MKRLVIILSIIALSACKTITTGVSSSHQADSIRLEYKHDSVFIERWHNVFTKGDTVYIYDSIFKDRWRERTIKDSIYINNTDTIYKTVEVEKKSSVFLRNSGIALWVILVVLLLATIVGIVLKFSK